MAYTQNLSDIHGGRGVATLKGLGSFNQDDQRIDELLSDISLTIDRLQNILLAVGTTADTLQQRQEFTKLRDLVNEKIRRATNHINAIIRNDALSLSSSIDGDYVDAAKYQEELKQIQQYSYSLRTIVSSARKQFQTFEAQSVITAEHDENSPLLQTATLSKHEFGSFAKDVTVITQKQMMEEEEEKISEIHSNLQHLKTMFEDLDEVVNEQGVVVDQLEHNVVVTKEAIGAGKTELETADERKRKARCNKIALLIVLLLVLALVLVFVWAYDRSK